MADPLLERHPYYCAQAEARNTFTMTWEEFACVTGQWWDPELNLVFRWDLVTQQAWVDDNGELPGWDGWARLSLFVMQQRKGRFCEWRIAVEEKNLASVREFLLLSWEAMRNLWAPLSGPDVMAGEWDSARRESFLVAHDRECAAGR